MILGRTIYYIPNNEGFIHCNINLGEADVWALGRISCAVKRLSARKSVGQNVVPRSRSWTSNVVYGRERQRAGLSSVADRSEGSTRITRSVVLVNIVTRRHTRGEVARGRRLRE